MEQAALKRKSMLWDEYKQWSRRQAGLKRDAPAASRKSSGPPTPADIIKPTWIRRHLEHHHFGNYGFTTLQKDTVSYFRLFSSWRTTSGNTRSRLHPQLPPSHLHRRSTCRNRLRNLASRHNSASTKLRCEVSTPRNLLASSLTNTPAG